MSSRNISWRYQRNLKALPPYHVANRSRIEKELTHLDLRKVYDRLGLSSQTRYLYIPCEEHSKTRCRSCKTLKVELPKFRRITNEDKTTWKRWLIMDVESGLPYMPSGKEPDNDIVECMVQYLVEDTSELTVEDPKIRQERMVAVCLSQMFFPNADNRLAGLVPKAYEAATIINAQRSDESLDRIDNLEDEQVILQKDVADLQNSRVKTDRHVNLLASEQRESQRRLVELTTEQTKTKDQVGKMLQAMVKANLFQDPSTNNDMPSPTIERLVSRSSVTGTVVGTPLADKKSAANTITPMLLDLEIDGTTIFTIIDSSSVRQKPDGFVRTKLNMPKPLRDFGSSSALMNKGLRNSSTTLEKSVAQDITLVKTTLSFLPDFSGTVMRASNHTLEFIHRLQQTKTFCDKGFLSTSLGGICMRYIGKNCRFIITSKTGKYIMPYVSKSYQSENEVTFLPGTVFDVVSVAKAANSWLGPDKDSYIIRMIEK